MIQDIAPRVYHPEYRDCQPKADDKVFCFWKDQVLITEANQVPTCAQVKGLTERHQYLFAIDREEFYLGTLSEKGTPPGTQWKSRQDLRTLSSIPLVLAGFSAWHLEHWYGDNKYCGRCGTVLEHMRNERKLQCPACGHRVFPRLNPSVIIAVHDGDRLLMSRYAKLPIPWFVLLAGFVEIGETAEQCVAREVREEVGIRVKNIRYYGSQPWGMSGNLTLAYTAELDGSDALHVNPDELAEARWFPRDQVPVMKEDRVSITQDMVRAFADGRI